MWDEGLLEKGKQIRSAPAAIEMTGMGLVFEGGALLVRMRIDREGREDLAVGADRDRMLAMLSIAYRRPIAASEVVAKVEAAADLWRRGEKALANLRLMYAGLAKSGDPTAGSRVALAAYLLDNGWPPAALLAELDLADRRDGLGKYNPNHVSAGHGQRSGQFDFKAGGSSASDGRIVVAGGESDEEYEAEHLFGGGDPKERAQHHQAPFDLAPPVPVMGGALVRPTAPGSGAAAERQLPAGIGPGPFAGKSVPAGPPRRPGPEKQSEINAIGRDTGCHTCGTTNPGTASGNFIGDHQPPNALRQAGEIQNYFPQCLRCSRAQGGNVTRFKAHGE